jgi:hypothetical protein
MHSTARSDMLNEGVESIDRGLPLSEASGHMYPMMPCRLVMTHMFTHPTVHGAGRPFEFMFRLQ